MTEYINTDGNSDTEEPVSFSIKTPPTQNVQINQSSGVTSLVDQSPPSSAMAYTQPMGKSTSSSSSSSGNDQTIGDQVVGGRQHGTTFTPEEMESTLGLDSSLLNSNFDPFDPQQTALQLASQPYYNPSYISPQPAMQPSANPYFRDPGGPASQPYYGDMSEYVTNSNSSQAPPAEEAQLYDDIMAEDLNFSAEDYQQNFSQDFNAEDPQNFLGGLDNPSTTYQGLWTANSNLDPTLGGDSQGVQTEHEIPQFVQENPATIRQGQYTWTSINGYSMPPTQETIGHQTAYIDNHSAPSFTQIPTDSSDSVAAKHRPHRWGDDPLCFTDSEEEDTEMDDIGTQRRKKRSQPGYCPTPWRSRIGKKTKGAKKTKGNGTGNDSENETDSEDDTVANVQKGKLRARFDPNHPHVRQSKVIEYKNSRGTDLEEYRAEDHYDRLPETPASWDCFEYTSKGELESDRRYTIEEMQRYLFNHPLHYNSQGSRDFENSKLQLRLQRVPADSGRRYADSVSSICRFADCQRRPDNDMRIGHYRVAFDEQSHKQLASDPFENAGYVHLYCLEKLMNFPQIAHSLNIRIEDRHLPCEIKGVNKMAMENNTVYGVAYDFLKACKKLTFSDQYRDYPYQLSGPNFGRDHSGTLTAALGNAKLAAEPESKRRKRLERANKSKELGRLSCNMEEHLGNLVIVCEFDKRKKQIRAAQYAETGRGPRTRVTTRKRRKNDSDDESDIPTPKRRRAHMPADEPWFGPPEGEQHSQTIDDIIESVGGSQVSHPRSRPLTRSQEAKKKATETANPVYAVNEPFSEDDSGPDTRSSNKTDTSPPRRVSKRLRQKKSH